MNTGLFYFNIILQVLKENLINFENSFTTY